MSLATPPRIARPRFRSLPSLLSLLAVAAVPFAAGAQSSPPQALATLHWRFVGPIGNRTAAVAGEPGNPMVDYAGAASGGIWKTENGGVDWKPVFDDENVAAIGALAVSRSEPHTVWAGTGETFLIRPFYPMGNGVYKSTDGGEHWEHMGLVATGHIGRIVIDPHDARRVFVCALGQLFKPQPERGIYRTTDGGKTWKHVLALGDSTGCNDLAMDPTDPNTLIAGMWPVLVHPWNLDSGGQRGGVYITRDGGDTWHKAVGHGMPDHPVGKVAVAIAHSDPQRMYALVQDKQPSFYRSDDGGETWRLVSHDHMMMQRDAYYVRFGVSPTDPDRLYFLSPNYVVSRDAAETFVGRGDGFASAGGDNHDIWIDPTNPNRIMVANDAGVSISLDGSRSFEHIRLPIAQVYHVSTDDQIPYNIYGNIQDASSFRGPSNNLEGGGYGGGISAADFQAVGGCESGFATPEPGNPDVVWSGCYEGVISRIDLRDGQARDVSVWPDVADGWAPRNVKYRWHWTIPLTISPFDSHTVYVGSQYVHETTDGGRTWRTISPDLTLNDPKYQGNAGGITYDNLYTYDASTLYSIAESPLKQGVIWAGTNDGQVSLTRDGGAHWTNVTKNIPGLKPMGTIWSIEPSHFDAGTAYITVNLEQMGDYGAYVYETSDYGRSWRLISGGVPRTMNSSAHCVIEDPVRKGMLYLGTDNAVYVTWDDGAHWTSIRANLPPAPVYWLTLQKRFNDLVISTYGRGDYILDDVTALRHLDAARAADAVRLFKPRPAYRFRNISNRRLSEPGARIVGQDPPYGADVNFYLPTADAHASVVILDSAGRAIRTLHVSGHAGLNRVWWDLRGENGRLPHMLVPPVGAPWMRNGPRGYHLLTGIMVPRVVRGVRVLPGTYTVRLTAGGHTQTQPLTVLADPHSLGTPATLAAQHAFKTQVLGEIDHVAGMIEELEWTRERAADIEAHYHADPAQTSVVDAARKLAAGAIAVEGKLIDVYLTDGNEDLNRHPSQLYQKLTALYDKDEADQGPTASDKAVNDYFRQWMQKSETELRQFRQTRVSAFNDLLRQRGIPAALQR
ncbi:MAG: glycosyl hydrolase [Gemmatimonadetes bacterium]|nr:glycosyl hydrolase [Gemmatimonadota bacterium]